MVARQESSALLGCRKKVFENACQMWFLVSAVAMVDVVTMMHLGQQLVDALPRISLWRAKRYRRIADYRRRVKGHSNLENFHEVF